MVLLKHLAREFDMSPARIRKLLRHNFEHNGRWRWEENDPQLLQIRHHLSANTSTPRQSTPTAPSPR